MVMSSLFALDGFRALSLSPSRRTTPFASLGLMPPPEPPPPPDPPQPPDPTDSLPEQICSSLVASSSCSYLPSTALCSLYCQILSQICVVARSKCLSLRFASSSPAATHQRSTSPTTTYRLSLSFVLPYRLEDPEAFLHLAFDIAASDAGSPSPESPKLCVATLPLASLCCGWQVAAQAVELREACLVFIISGSLPLPYCQVMHLFFASLIMIASYFPSDCIDMSFGGKSFAFVRSFTAVCSPFTAVCSPFPGFILDIGNIKIGLLPLWHIGLTLLMSIHPVNLVVFSSVEYVLLSKSPFGLSGILARCLLLKGFVPFIRMGIYGFVDVAWEVQSLFRAEPPHFGTRRQFLFPKFPLVWSGLDDQASPVLKGSSSRLMASSALVAEFVTLWVALDAVTLEAFGIVLFRSPLVFVVELYFQSISILPYCSVLSSFACIVILYFTFVMVVIPPRLSEVET